MASRSMTSRTCQGQALIEACIALLVLVPLFLFGWLLADMQSLQHATIAATRHTALEAFHQQPDRLEWLKREHFASFSHLAESTSIRIETALQAEAVRNAEELAFLALEPALLVGVGQFDLARGAALRAQTNVTLEPAALLPRWLELPQLTLQEKMMLMHDDWDAADPAQVRSRTAALSVAGRMSEWKTLLEPVAWALSLIEPAFSRMCFGRIDPELVPADRLPDSLTRQSDLRTQRCD